MQLMAGLSSSNEMDRKIDLGGVDWTGLDWTDIAQNRSWWGTVVHSL
jgi:hypothetical protein